jgi:hypothetical protein
VILEMPGIFVFALPKQAGKFQTKAESARPHAGGNSAVFEIPAGSAQMTVTKIADHLAHGQWSFGDDVLAERVQS